MSVHVSDKLSGTIKSAQIARDMLSDREIHIVDSTSVSMAQGILAEIGVAMAADDASAADIAAALNARRPDIVVMLAMDTLEYLKRGGRISGARAAIGTILSVKPVIEVKDGVVETVDKPRTRGKARERLIELVCTRPIERLSVLHSTNADVETFRDAIVARVPGGIDPSRVSVDLISASVGPHVGPGSVGAIALYRAS